MMYRNSFKILLSNFVNVWKVLAYKVGILVLSLGVVATFSFPVITELTNANFFENILTIAKDNFLSMNLSKLLIGIESLISQFFAVIGSFSTSLLTLTIIGIITLVLLVSFLNGLYELAMTDHISGIMSCNVKYGFSNCFAQKIVKSFKLQIVRTLIVLPITLALLVAFYFSLKLLAISTFMQIFAPLVIITVAIVLISLKSLLFSGWLPAIVVHDKSIWESLHIGIDAVSKRFWRTLSSYICIIISIIIVNLFALFFTAGAGLVVTLPASALLLIIFNLVMYYGSNGMRYYVDSDTILSPKKREEQDSFNRLKNII